MVRGVAVILDVLALLPNTEVVESGCCIEAHCGSFLFWMKYCLGFDQETRHLKQKHLLSSSCKRWFE